MGVPACTVSSNAQLPLRAGSCEAHAAIAPALYLLASCLYGEQAGSRGGILHVCTGVQMASTLSLT